MMAGEVSVRPTVWMGATIVPCLLACAGPGGAPPPLVVRVDYSHVDGGSCMSAGGRPSLAWKETWDLSGCPKRGTDYNEVSDACIASLNAECCTQIGGEVLAWEAHTNGSEKVISPLCRIP